MSNNKKSTQPLDIIQPYICVIGGSNIDIIGYPSKTLKLRDSNPGTVKTSLGGVGRNIAENLARLGIDTKFLSVVGNDTYGQGILSHAESIGLDMSHALIADAATSTYLGVLDETGDMRVGIADMDILNRLDIDYIEQHSAIIEGAEYCVVDTNLPDMLEYIVTHFDVPFILDTVSAQKAPRAKHLLSYFHTIKPNKIEAEVLSGISIDTENDLQRTGTYFTKHGVKNLYITMGTDGVYYKSDHHEGIITSPAIEMVNATGAGDAFVAGLVYGLLEEKEIEERVKCAIASSNMAILSQETINPDLTSHRIEELVKELTFIHKQWKNKYAKI